MYTTLALLQLIDSQSGIINYENAKQARRNKFKKNRQAAKEQKLKEKRVGRKNIASERKAQMAKEKLRNAVEADSQSGLSAENFTQNIRQILDEWELPSGFTMMILKIVCYYRSVRKSVDFDQFASTTGLFLCSLCDSDSEIMKTISTVLFDNSTMDLHTLTETDIPMSQSGLNFSEIMESLKGLRIIKDNGFTRMVTKVIATAFACGLVKGKKDLYLTSFNLSFVLEQFTKESDTVFDFFGALVDIFQFMVERGQVCFKERSFSPLFMSDDGTADYDKDLAEVLGFWPAVQAGNFSDTPYVNVPHFANALDQLHIATVALVEQSNDSFSKRYYSKNLEKLNSIKSRFSSQERSGGLREAPFAFCIYGKSSIGKSSVMQTLVDFSLKAMAVVKDPNRTSFKIDPRVICSQNGNDKYDSDYKSYTLAVIFDDLANEKCEVSNQSPLDAIIRYINNVKSTALKADVQEKGMVQKEPWLVAASTNVKNLQADQYSIEPLSQLRRFGIHIEPKVAKEYQKDDGIFLDGKKLAAAGQAVPDVWLFDAFYYQYTSNPVKQTHTNTTYGYQSIPFMVPDGNGGKKPATGINMEELQHLIFKLIQDHVKTQKSVVESNNNICHEILCEHHVHKAICSVCSPDHTPPNPMAFCPESHAGEKPYKPAPFSTRIFGLFLWWSFCFLFGFFKELYMRGTFLLFWRTKFPNATNKIESLPYHIKYYKDATVFYTKNWFRNVSDTIDELNSLRFIPWTFSDLIPESVICNPRFAWIYMFKYDQAYYPQLIASVILLWMSSVYITFKLTGLYHSWYYFWGILAYIYSALLMRKAYLMRTMMQERAIRRNILKYTMKSMIGTSIQFMLTFGGIVISYKMMKLVLDKIRQLGRASHGGDVDIGMETENVWLPVARAPLPSRDIITDTMSYQHVVNAVRKNITTVIYNNKGFSTGLFTRNNVLLVPTHELKQRFAENNGVIELELRKSDKKELCGGNVKIEITPARTYDFPDRDISAVFNNRYPDKQDLFRIFPKELPQDKNATFWIGKTSDGSDEAGECRRVGIHPRIRTNITQFTDSTQVAYRNATKGGDCMRTHIAKVTSGSYVAGFHLAGKDYQGFLSTLTQDELTACYEHFNSNPCTRLTANVGTMRTEQYGIDYTPTEPTHNKSTINYLEGGQVEYFGDLKNFRVRATTGVIQSPISDLVASHTGIENEYGPPANCRKDDTRVPAQAPYNKYYVGVLNAHQEFPLEILQKAVEDYFNDCFGNKRLIDDVKTLRKLTMVECVSGQDGIKFVDSMKMSTSKGFPLTGSKEDIVVSLAPEEHPGISCPRTVTPEIQQEVECALDSLRKGERFYPVFKACTKDEPTKLTKTKVRVFQSAPLVLQILLRKYFLPIAAALSRNPTTTECAVGINSQGPQWNKMMKYLSKFGKERMVAGDFKAYDQHMSSNMTSAAFNVLIELAKLSPHYSEEDIFVMQNLVVEVTHPVMNVNGDLVMLLGSNASGQNLTVYINSIVNSLYQRCVFFIIYPFGTLPTNKFSDYVALMTYGDDNEMSVSALAPEYNHTRMQEVYADHGIEYTMAEKEAESVPYIDLEDADFLKRKSTWRSEYTDPTTNEKGMWLASLSEASIAKSLHSNLKSGVVDPDEIARQCLDGAMREWWFHGRDVFEMRHEQMKRIIVDKEWEHMISPHFYKSFNEREEEWLEKYNLVKNN